MLKIIDTLGYSACQIHQTQWLLLLPEMLLSTTNPSGSYRIRQSGNLAKVAYPLNHHVAQIAEFPICISNFARKKHDISYTYCSYFFYGIWLCPQIKFLSMPYFIKLLCYFLFYQSKYISIIHTISVMYMYCNISSSH